MLKNSQVEAGDKNDNRDVSIRMRCVEFSSFVNPATEVLDFASELYFWVTTGRRK